MFNLTIVSLPIILIGLAFIIAAHLLPSRNTNLEKTSPYECGFDPLNFARIPFSFRFFLVAILFLLFDLEIALLFPFPQAIFSLDPNFVLFLIISFLLILTLGLIFEWTQGGLDWAE